jgi:hypothetical protein
LAQEIFDLAVDTPQLVGGPSLELGPELGIDPEKESFAFVGHESGFQTCVGMDCSRKILGATIGPEPVRRHDALSS